MNFKSHTWLQDTIFFTTRLKRVMVCRHVARSHEVSLCNEVELAYLQVVGEGKRVGKIVFTVRPCTQTEE